MHSGGVISAKEQRNNRYSVLPNKKEMTLRHYSSSKKNIVEALDNIINLFPGACSLLLFQLLSLSSSKYKDNCKPRFLTMVVGPSGSYKSSVCEHIFGIFEEYFHRAPVNLKIATLASVHALNQQFRDTVTLFDDCAPSKIDDENRNMMKLCETLSRAVGDDTGRTKMADSHNIISYAPLGLFAITGEYFPFQNTSDLGRVFLVEISKTSIKTSKLTKVQNQKMAYISAIVDYIYWISKNGEHYVEIITMHFYKYRKEFLDKYRKSHKRTAENIAWLYAEMEMFIAFCKEFYNIDKKTGKSWKKQFEGSIKQSEKSQREIMEKDTDSDLFIRTITDCLNIGDLSLTEITVGAKGKQSATASKNTIGYKHGKYIYLMPELAYNRTKQYLNKSNRNYALPEIDLMKRLRDSGSLICSENGKLKSKLSLNGSRIGLYKFEKSVFGI